MAETKVTKIKIAKGRRPTIEQLRIAVTLARQRKDERIVLINPGDGEVWGSAPTDEVETYVKTIDAVKWPFATNRRNKKVVIE